MPTSDKETSAPRPDRETTPSTRAAPPKESEPQSAPPPAEEKPPEEKVLDKKDVPEWLRSGHKLKKKGDPPSKWVAAARIHNQVCIAQPLDEDLEKALVEHDWVQLPD